MCEARALATVGNYSGQGEKLGMRNIVLLGACLLTSCTTVYVRERFASPAGGVVAVRGSGWSLEGPDQEYVDQSKALIKAVCSDKPYLVTSKSVEPTMAGNYWTLPFFGLMSFQFSAEEFRYKFRCEESPKSGA